MFDKKAKEWEDKYYNMCELATKYEHQLNSKEFKDKRTSLQKDINTMNNQIESIKNDISIFNQKKSEIQSSLQEEYRNEVVDVSELSYMCKYSKGYKRKIDEIRNKQKAFKDVIIANGYIAKCNEGIYNSIASMMQSNFDMKCDDIMNKVKYTSKNNLSERINSLAKRIERQSKNNILTFNPKYIDLKVEEIYMVFEYQCKLQYEKEKRDIEKEILKDQAKADKETLKALKDQEKKRTNLQYQYNKRCKDNKPTDDIESQLKDLDDNMEINQYRLTHQKSGYVYVVGNRDMKDGLRKIGVTKRDVATRMSELGTGASHSFPMEVYGYVFVDDCYGVESKLHKYLSEYRLNVGNPRKEWFVLDLDKIKDAFKEVCGVDIELSEKPCEDYIDSLNKFGGFY